MSPCSSTVADGTRLWRHCPRASRAGMSSSALAHVIVSGLATGCIYGLVALSLVIVYNATRTVTFAQGEMLMVSAFVAWSAQRTAGLPVPLARRHALGCPHQYARPLPGAAGGRRDGMDERRAAISPSLLEPAREHWSRARGPGISRHHRRLPRAHALPRGALPLT